jgi:hypothetical protein
LPIADCQLPIVPDDQFTFLLGVASNGNHKEQRITQSAIGNWKLAMTSIGK